MSEADDVFWDCAGELFNVPGVVESTMFGFKCIRVDDEFVGMPANGALVVKLPAHRVDALIDSETGNACAPNGRRFKEWVEIPTVDEDLWLSLLTESIEFVRPNR